MMDMQADIRTHQETDMRQGIPTDLQTHAQTDTGIDGQTVMPTDMQIDDRGEQPCFYRVTAAGRHWLSHAQVQDAVWREATRVLAPEAVLAGPLLATLSGRLDAAALSLWDCADVLHFLRRFPAQELRYIARCGSMPEQYLSIRLDVRLRGDGTPCQQDRLLRRLQHWLTGSGPRVPGLRIAGLLLHSVPAKPPEAPAANPPAGTQSDIARTCEPHARWV